jgi:hypothetical protein
LELKILVYIRKSINEGHEYFKSKYIAKDIGVSSKEVGTTLFNMSKKKLGGIKIIKYAQSLSTTWKAIKLRGYKKFDVGES